MVKMKKHGSFTKKEYKNIKEQFWRDLWNTSLTLLILMRTRI